MFRTETRTQSRAVKGRQVERAEAVCSEPFLERFVRPHLGPGAPVRGGTWTTKVIQLDGTGAATVQVELDGGSTVFAKLFPFDDGPAVFAKLQALRSAGLGADSRYQAVEPLAWYDQEKVLLCRGAPGRAVSELVGGDPEPLTAAVAEAGAWLGRLHGSPIRFGRPQSLLVTGELTSLAKRLSKVAVDNPTYLDTALGMLERLDRLTYDTVDGLLAQSHGQYRPIHVFIAPEVVTVIDLDRSAPADPARDVAEFLHRLRLAVHGATGEIGAADGPCAAFLAAYREAVGGVDTLANLRFHWARYVFHSLNRKVKTGEVHAATREDATYRLYRDEFDRVIDGRALA
jgi:hypothetical protein